MLKLNRLNCCKLPVRRLFTGDPCEPDGLLQDGPGEFSLPPPQDANALRMHWAKDLHIPGG